MTYIQEDIVASDTEPATIVDGMTWIDTSGSNIEFHDRIAGSWETRMARGPDTPTYPVEGSVWRNTGAGSMQQYDGGSWVNIGVTDHANLSNVTSDQHHIKPTSTQTASNSVAQQIGSGEINDNQSFNLYYSFLEQIYFQFFNGNTISGSNDLDVLYADGTQDTFNFPVGAETTTSDTVTPQDKPVDTITLRENDTITQSADLSAYFVLNESHSHNI